jgi:peptidoglycan hydrolase-like protein with peptidoglycan-binding domain
MPGAVQPGIRQDDRATGQPRSDSDVSNRPGSDMKGHGTSGSTGSMSGSTGSMSGAASNANADQVRQVQEALKAQGHDPGPIDGTMGAQTQEALRAFQKSKDLPVTGQLDSETIDKLGVGQAQSR